MAKKLILVDPQQWRAAATAPSLPDSLGSSISTLDQEMKNILDDKTGDIHTKAQLYQQVLQRYLHLVEKYRERPLGKIEVPNESSSPLVKNESSSPIVKNDKHFQNYILRNVPKPQRNKAERLFEEMNKIPELSWDSRNQLVYANKLVKGSNAIDLINDLVQERRSAKYTPPKGWEILANALKSVNVPRSVIGNSKRWTFMQDVKDEEKDNTTTWEEY